jgi:hypothetical protein
MSFYQLPTPWNPGYAIPDYVMAEPPERGTFTTQWLPRGTIPALVPDFMAKPMGGSPSMKLLGRTDAGLSGLGDSRYELVPNAQSLGSDAAEYGNVVAMTLIEGMKKIPPAKRVGTMKRAMDILHPTLYARANDYAAKLAARGVTPPRALQQGIARAVSDTVARRR